MKFTIVTLLVLAAYAQAKSFEPVEPLTSAYGYLERSVALGEEIRQREEEYLNKQRIIGGVPAQNGQFPFQAGIVTDIVGINGRGVCGASLVSGNRLVTAAHCWFDGVNQAWRVTVRLGSVLLFGTDGTTVQTSVVVSHPNWFPALARNDVAVIFLSSPVTFSATISPVSLPSGSVLTENFAGEIGVVSGFGLTSNDGAIGQDQTLRHVSLNIMNNDLCSRLFLPTLVQPTNICTSGVGGVGACSGDSGGPLSVVRNGENVLVGVVSFGPPVGCEASLPSVYARVTSFIGFINQHL